MTERKISPNPGVVPLLAGHFQMSPSYTTWRPKGSEDWLLIYTRSGSGSYFTRSGEMTSAPGHVLLYSPGETQEYRTAKSSDHWELQWAHFRPPESWNRLLQWPPGELDLKCRNLSGEEQEGCEAALHEVVEFSRRSIPMALDLAMNALEKALLWCQVAGAEDGPGPRDSRIMKAADYLSAHLADEFDLGQLARRGNLSVSRMAHLFKAEMGVSPQQYLERQRMSHASQLLQLTGLSVEEVAREVGYSDPFYFSNRFRRSMGMSPSRYRKEQESAARKAL